LHAGASGLTTGTPGGREPNTKLEFDHTTSLLPVSPVPSQRIAEGCAQVARVAAENRRQNEIKRRQRQRALAAHSKAYFERMAETKRNLASRPLLMELTYESHIGSSPNLH
jgi:hypothetical protein